MYNNQQHRFMLDGRNITGRRQQKVICPQCGRKSLVRYVDLHHDCKFLDDAVGRCDHEQSCGYHYRPSDYFHDRPWLKEQSDMTFSNPVIAPKELPFIPLDMALVLRSQSTQSIFCRWLSNKIAPQLDVPKEEVQCVFKQYHIGTTRQGDVIFWQIDHQQQVHTGHIMRYQPDGHRTDWQSWTHFRLQKRGLLPENYQPPKCFFGEHLLPLCPGATVCVVESEKTALIMALQQPEYVWIATAGCGGLSIEKTRCLKGRRVRIFPDSGCYKKWSEQMRMTTGIDYYISSDLEAYPANTDLADLVLNSISEKEDKPP